MISCNEFNRSGLGNHLFRYAFLRSTAHLLSVQFYCPAWIGDEIFLLNDGNERAKAPAGINTYYREPKNCCGFNENAVAIKDGTDIWGYFLSEKYYSDKEEVRKWYRFKDDKVVSVKAKYEHIDFRKSVGIHVRLGDIITERSYLPKYYVPPLKYYTSALSKIKQKKNILVFSDDVELAEKHLGGLVGNVIYMDGNRDYEDLYLMTQCHDFVCSASTLSWWGAWLNGTEGKTVVVPKEGALRPGGPIKNEDFWPKEWTHIQALRKVFDNYRIMSFFGNRFFR